jgi:RNA polymerase sigma-70 factor (ECF subfamily)
MNEAAFRSLYEQHRDALFRFGVRLTGSPETAEDLVHDSFLGLYRGGWDQSRASAKTYLYGAVRNLAYKRHRDLGREASDCDADAQVDAVALGSLISKEASEAVRRAVMALPASQKEVLVLFEYEDLPLSEIAQIVEADVGAVKSRLHRARESLRKWLAPAFEEATR